MRKLTKKLNEWNITLTPDEELRALKFERFRREFGIALGERNTKLLIKLVRPFIEELLWIRDKEQRLIPFILNRTQRFIMDIIELCWYYGLPVRLIILKARQEGVSTLIEAILFVLTIMLKNTKAKIISYNRDSVINIYKISDRFYTNLPITCQPDTRYYTAEHMHFQSRVPERNLDSEIVIDQAKQVKSGRSETINILHISEMGLMEEIARLLTSVMNSVPKLSPFSLVGIESTAQGVGNTFHKRWLSGISLKKFRIMIKTSNGRKRLINKYIKIFIPWYYMEEYRLTPPTDWKINSNNRQYGNEKDYKRKYKLSNAQIYWREITIDGPECHGDIDEFRQEYPANEDEAFIASGRTRFHKGRLEELRELTKPPLTTGYLRLVKDINRNNPTGVPIIEFKENPEESLDIWEYPIKHRIVTRLDGTEKKFPIHYVIGADVAEGKIVEGRHTDRSIAEVVRRDTMEQVARWRGRVTPARFADILYLLGYYYNFAWLGIEINNHGHVVIDRLQERYGMLYYRLILTEATLRETREYGWLTDLKTRPLMIDDLEDLILERNIKINGEETVTELLSFILTPRGRPEAQSGAWDDEVIALAITNQMHKLMPKIDHYSKAPVMSSYSMRR